MGKKRVTETLHIEAPPELVFDRLADHEAMADWPGIKSCRLVVEGTPRNGLGAVRRIQAGGVTLDEEIVHFEPPHRMDYSIIRGLPVKHLGSVTLRGSRGGTELIWQVSIESRVPLLAQIVGRLLGRGLPGALAHFKQGTERAASTGVATPAA